MISIILYCSAVLVILVLYYLYKPTCDTSLSSFNGSISTSNNANQLSTNENVMNVNKIDRDNSNLMTQSFENLSPNDHMLSPNELNALDDFLYSKSSLDSSISTSNNSSSITLTNRNNSCSFYNGQSNQYNSINDDSFTDNKTWLSCKHLKINIYHELWLRIFKFYTNHIMPNILPLYKYLGLSEPSQFSNYNLFILKLKMKNILQQKNEENYKSFDELLAAFNQQDIFNNKINKYLFSQNLEKNEYACNFIVGIDFSASNEWKGRKTFNSQSLHKTTGDRIVNPYQKVMSSLSFSINKILMRLYAKNNSQNIIFDSNSLHNYNSNYNNNLLQQFLNSLIRIYAFGFGDVDTKDRNVFSFVDNTPFIMKCMFDANEICNFDLNHFDSFDDVLVRYNELVRRVNLSGPTCFAPIIFKSIEIIKSQHQFESKSFQKPMKYHVLFIITDDGQLSFENENKTINAIKLAAKYPLFISCIGVGDGPWHSMRKFENCILNGLSTDISNFQFIDYQEILANVGVSNTTVNNNNNNGIKTNKTNSKMLETAFILKAFGKIPNHYKQMKTLNLI